MLFFIFVVLPGMLIALIVGQVTVTIVCEFIWPGSGSFAQRCAYCPVRGQARLKYDDRPYGTPYDQFGYDERPYEPRYDANAPTMPVQQRVSARRQRKPLPRSRRSYPVRRQVQRR